MSHATKNTKSKSVHLFRNYDATDRHTRAQIRQTQNMRNFYVGGLKACIVTVIVANRITKLGIKYQDQFKTLFKVCISAAVRRDRVFI